MMSDATVLRYRPYLLKAHMLAGATDPIAGGADTVGLGGIDFASAHFNGHCFWYAGDNDAFDQFDREDGNQDGFIEGVVSISNGWIGCVSYWRG